MKTTIAVFDIQELRTLYELITTGHFDDFSIGTPENRFVVLDEFNKTYSFTDLKTLDVPGLLHSALALEKTVTKFSKKIVELEEELAKYREAASTRSINIAGDNDIPKSRELLITTPDIGAHPLPNHNFLFDARNSWFGKIGENAYRLIIQESAFVGNKELGIFLNECEGWSHTARFYGSTFLNVLFERENLEDSNDVCLLMTIDKD